VGKIQLFCLKFVDPILALSKKNCRSKYNNRSNKWEVELKIDRQKWVGSSGKGLGPLKNVVREISYQYHGNQKKNLK
jgi:hypothetical protein